MSTRTDSVRSARRKNRPRLTEQERRQRNEAAYARLTEAIDGLMTHEGWQSMIQSRAWLRRYSFHNLMMITMQYPEARDVRPLSEWNTLGRRVRKGEKAIRIWAPRTRRARTHEPTDDKTGQTTTEKILAGFILVNVFDVGQTERAPLPERPRPRPQLLSGDAPGWLWDHIAAQITALGFTVHRGAAGGANGRTRWGPRTVTVRDDVEPAQAVKTLVHELAHILCDHEAREISRPAKEVEAESVAYIVCAAAGLTTLSYSVPYVAAWAPDRQTVTDSAERVLAVADRILGRLALDGGEQE